MILLQHHNRLRPQISIATRKSLKDVLSSMRFGLTRDLSLKRSFTYYSITAVGSREQPLKSTVTMATKSENLVETATDEKDKGEDKKKIEEVSIPPPPEKPEPGDCCGNGCVRCVWDVYYEELEDYNKLISPKSGDKIDKSN